MSAAVSRESSSKRSLEVLVVGGGFGGIAAAIELRRHGIEAVTILESAGELGGTWFYNSYPGAACDVPSHLYSFSFAQRRDWSQLCSARAEIHAYLKAVAREHRVDELLCTGSTVTSCTWSQESCRWTVQTAEGATHEADALVLATGQLHQPHIPAIEGLEAFAGHTFHSARWDHDYSLAGRRVAVVGTGASAVQFVPEIAQEVEHLSIFQRTGNWFLPRKNRPYPRVLRWAIESIPGLQSLRRAYIFQYTEAITLAIRHPRTVGRLMGSLSAAFMRSQLRDPEIRRRAWPDFTFGCKRILFSSQFLTTLQDPNVELITDRIERISAGGIVTSDARVHELDCIIWATGFKTNDFMFPMQITGCDGVDLRAQWSAGAHAHLGITVPGFPNMFVMYGPNTNTSGGSIIVYLEAQAAYIRQALQRLGERQSGAIEVRPEVEHESDRVLQRRFAGTAWTQCDSWYRDDSGRIVANWPGYMREYLKHTRELDASEYRFHVLPDRATVVSPQRGWGS